MMLLGVQFLMSKEDILLRRLQPAACRLPEEMSECAALFQPNLEKGIAKPCHFVI